MRRSDELGHIRAPVGSDDPLGECGRIGGAASGAIQPLSE